MARRHSRDDSQARRIVDLSDVVLELYRMIVDELDPDPHPIDDYFADGRLGQVAQRALSESRFRARVREVGSRADHPTGRRSRLRIVDELEGSRSTDG